jgi:hypothetical protein
MNDAGTRQPTLRHVGIAVLVAAVGLLCALVVAGCGSSSAAPGTSSTSTAASTTTTGTSTTSAGDAAFRACLTQHGATIPSGGGFGGGGFGGGGGGKPGAVGGNRPAPSAALQKALSACASLRPAGGFGGRGGARPGGAGANSSNPAFAKFESCLKAHGVTSSNSKNSASAIAACRSDLPNRGNQAPAGSTTTTSAG